MKHFISAALMLIGLGCSGDDTGLFVAPQNQNLGVVDGVVHEVEYKIVNNLDHPVNIEQTYPSCGCTSLDLSANPVPAGGTSILRATANLKDRPGYQKFSIFVATDCTEYPTFGLTFEAMVKASGEMQRHYDLGHFTPGARVDFHLPYTAFARGSIGDMVEDRILNGLTVKPSDDGLHITGAAPTEVGQFTLKLKFKESFEQQPELGSREIQLELTGNIAAKWNIAKELYGGFLGPGDQTIRLEFEHNKSQQRVLRDVSAEFQNEWASLSRYSVNENRLVLELEIDREKVSRPGAFENQVNFNLKYDDDLSEAYTAKLFVRVEDG